MVEQWTVNTPCGNPLVGGSNPPLRILYYYPFLIILACGGELVEDLDETRIYLFYGTYNWVLAQLEACVLSKHEVLGAKPRYSIRISSFQK